MVLLTGAAGSGKSRLRRELMRRLEARGQGIELWLAEADAQQAGSPFSVVAQVLRRALGLGPDETPEVRCEKILARLARHPGGAGAELADRLGELVGARFGDEGGEAGAARQEQTPLSENTRQAFLSFLRAECAARPVVIALEDLHWGDLPSIKLIDAALGALSDQPLMVLAIARTELHEIFPRLWADRGVQEIRLRKLPRRACEQLVRQVLGDAAEDEALRRLVERSEGHPAFLEELLRAAAAGGPRVETPQAVLAMIQARIERLDPAARRVLRAASIFGETFWRGGVEVLLGGGEAAAWLTELVEQDVVAVEEGGRFPGDLQLRFRHPLVREAVYGMLTESDRVTGHWLAGQWLEQVGEPDPDVIARHYELGDPGRLT
jgi:predicted ATPase